MPNGRKCWAGNAVRQVDDGWRNADAAACQHWRPGCSAPTDTVVRGRSDTGELSLLAWRGPGRERRARHRRIAYKWYRSVEGDAVRVTWPFRPAGHVLSRNDATVLEIDNLTMYSLGLWNSEWPPRLFHPSQTVINFVATNCFCCCCSRAVYPRQLEAVYIAPNWAEPIEFVVELVTGVSMVRRLSLFLLSTQTGNR